MSREREAILKRPSIAVVDDDSAVRNSLAFAFQNEGFAVQAYESAEDLLGDQFGSEVDCFIIDYKLPGANGLDLLSELRRRRISAPAILVTTDPSAEVRRKAVFVEAAIVEKPLLGEILFQAVRMALKCGPNAAFSDHRREC